MASKRTDTFQDKNVSMGNQVAVDMPDDEVEKDNLNSENTQIPKKTNPDQNVVETAPLMHGDFCTTDEPLENQNTLGTVEINQKNEQSQELAIQESHTDAGTSFPSDQGNGLVEGKYKSGKSWI